MGRMRRGGEEKTVESVKREDIGEMKEIGIEMIESGIGMIETDTEMIEIDLEMTEEGLPEEVQEMTEMITGTEEEVVLQEMVTKVTEEKMIVGNHQLASHKWLRLL